jgi:hypothetical protein
MASFPRVVEESSSVVEERRSARGEERSAQGEDRSGRSSSGRRRTQAGAKIRSKLRTVRWTAVTATADWLNHTPIAKFRI